MKRNVLVVASVLAVLVVVAACSLFVNREPVARIVATPLAGERPLVVTFSGEGSYDPDGTVQTYVWRFGDGATATGVRVNHVYAPPQAATYTATLTVTDDEGAVNAASQTIEVEAPTAPGNNPPSPRFTFTPTHGDAPLAVTFDATLTRDVDGEVAVYAWDFGDGSTGSGPVISHTYEALASTNYAATLTATDDDGRSASTTSIVSVYVLEDVPVDGPTAAFVVGAPVLLYDSPDRPEIPSLFDVMLDPEGATAARNHEIIVYIWTFGDGESLSTMEKQPVHHVYRSGAPSHTFVVGLTVIDDQGLQDSAVHSVMVRNK